jgi:hypothetical protein
MAISLNYDRTWLNQQTALKPVEKWISVNICIFSDGCMEMSCHHSENRDSWMAAVA